MITLTDEDAGLRLDAWLKETFPGIGFGQLQKLCRTGQIRLDGKRVKGNERLIAGQEVRIPPSLQQPAAKERSAKPTRVMNPEMVVQVPGWVVYEDEEIIVLNKPVDLPTQAGTKQEVSMDRLVQSHAGKAYEAKLLHRLDKGTSGVLMFGKSRSVASFITRQFKERTTEKVYLALTTSHLPGIKGKMVHQLAKIGKAGDQKMAVVENGDEAITRYRVLAKIPGYQLVKLMPKTGRMHQLRVQLAAEGCPIVGDVKYGGEPMEEVGLMLHAYQLTFLHPSLKTQQTVYADVPATWDKWLKLLQFEVDTLDSGQQ